MKEMNYVMLRRILDTLTQEGEFCQYVRGIYKTRRIIMRLNLHN